MAKFEVEIGGNVAGLDKALNTAQSKLGAFNSSIQNTTTPLNSLKNSSNSAGFALTNLGRVAQDAPFGFIGIQNNLNPLLESFQRLRQESGSNASALKALGSSLIGAGGLGLALSLVSGAILIYQNGITGIFKPTKDAKDETKSYISTLNELRAANLNGAQDAQKELASLDTLFRATKNLTLSTKERDLATKQIQNTALKTLGSLTDENGKVLTLEQTYQKLKSVLIQVAQVRASEEKISQLATRQLENEQKILDATTEKLKQEGIARKNLQTIKSGNAPGQSSNFFAKEAELAEKKAIESKKIINNLETDNSKILKQQLSLVNNINEITQRIGVNPLVDTEKTNESVKSIKTVAEILKELSIELLKVENDVTKTFGEVSDGKIKATQNAISSLIENGVKPTSNEINKLKSDISDLGSLKINAKAKINLTGLQLPTIENTFFDDLTSNFEKLAGRIQPGILAANRLITDFGIGAVQNLNFLNSDINNIINGGLTDTFSQIGQGIGDALLTGGSVINAAGGALLSGLGSVLSQLGKAAIAAGVAALGIQAVLKTPLNPVTALAAIAGGIGLVAVGAILGGLGKSVSNGGGSNVKAANVSGGSSSVSTGGGSSSGSSNSSFSGSNEVVFKIYGTELIGVLNRAGAKLATYQGP